MQLSLLPRAEILFAGRFASVLSPPTPLGASRGIRGVAYFALPGVLTTALVHADHLEVMISATLQGPYRLAVDELAPKILEVIAATAPPVTPSPVRVGLRTAGTNVRWDNLRGWLAGATELARAGNKKARGACQRHALALAGEPEHILAANDLELGQLWPLLSCNQRHGRAPFFDGSEVHEQVAYAAVLRAFDTRATELRRRSCKEAT